MAPQDQARFSVLPRNSAHVLAARLISRQRLNSKNRPGRNVTGVTQLNSELVSKRLGLLHDLLPNAKIVGFLVNAKDPRAESQSRDIHRTVGTPDGL